MLRYMNRAWFFIIETLYRYLRLVDGVLKNMVTCHVKTFQDVFT